MNNKFKLKLLLVSAILLGTLLSKSQDPNRFKDQIDRLFNMEYNFNPNKKLVVFTGSSSVAMWKDIQDYYPEYNVVNNGFGGSHFSDLIHFYDELILRQTADVLFIYEGDNDIAGNKKPNKIYKEARSLIKRIKNDLPQTRVVIISPKPSIAREHLKKEYIKLNKKLKKYCKKQDNVAFADVWSIMMDENGNVYKDIFIEDGLHMNKKGYDLWDKVISEFLKQ